MQVLGHLTRNKYLLLNIAMGGVAGAIPSNFTQATMEIDYVRVYQNTQIDTEAPTNFTATVGNVTSSSVQLLLNASDNSGNVVYSINYNGQNITTASASGVQKSVIIPNLMPTTNYSFSVSASDVAGNVYANNPINLNATTLGVVGCTGTDNEAQQGSFSTGYNYAFETIGNDVKITFELLDTDKVGVVAFLWRQTPFTEYQMTNISGNTYSYTITNQTIGATISYAVKFAYAGGLSVTKYFTYVVGDNCLLTIDTFELDQFSFQNPVTDFININTSVTIDKVEIYTLLGKLVLSSSTTTESIDVKNLAKGLYLLAVYQGNKKSIKKMIVK